MVEYRSVFPSVDLLLVRQSVEEYVWASDSHA